MSDIILLGQNFLALFMESAPWLLLGLFVAGVMHELVPVSFLERHMGSNSIRSISKAAVIGAPLPLCSCGVIPAALGLRRSGASKSSTISFLVSTPETGVDSVSVSYALLGPLFAIIRPIAAVASAIYAGIMVKVFGDSDSKVNKTAEPVSSCCESETTKPVESSSCCSTKADVAQPSSCCSSSQHESGNHSMNANSTGAELTDHSLNAFSSLSNAAASAARVARYASGKLLEDIVVWLLIGLALAAAIKTWVPTDFLTQWGDGLVAMLVMAFIGIPMYICATASTPLAVGFLAAGLSPGAILVFLMAGPATNISTMGMIKQEMGLKTLALYLFSVVSASIAFGYLLNYLVSAMSLQGLIQTQSALHEHGGGVQVAYALSAIILGALMLCIGINKLMQYRHTQTPSSCCH
ncbi:SO_0444 family Cu/Zn efflux transporter [Alteromonas genovensis]|uniref:SO_0444 family Cu/Zn efflux transporter n=1 Tax=Alteromonas genovensis TaxID=471225 RepID=A0A6N9TJP7_9ALTE|nr:SO_0444 family Cu/Zn efflux transporter [Alteromonas genovensis]NDW16126.1 SO_0444 family Cu/Zn efflux transporter [Alteromonas genovensis]